jgi:hypothetical protein
MPTPRERLLLIFEAEHPETADPGVKDEAIRRTFGLEPAHYRALVAELLHQESRADAA